MPIRDAPEYPDEAGQNSSRKVQPLGDGNKDSGLLSKVVEVPYNLAGAVARTMDGILASRDADGAVAEMSVDSILADSPPQQQQLGKESIEPPRTQAPELQWRQADEDMEQEWGNESLEPDMAHAEKTPLDISKFLQTSGTLETRYLRMLSSLCSLTYRFDVLTVSAQSTPSVSAVVFWHAQPCPE